MMSQLPVIFGLSGKTLTADEVKFFKRANPFGYILFARNIENAEQLRALTQSIKELSGDQNIPILIDQEGGRVARIRPPLCEEFKPAQFFGDIAKTDMPRARKMVYENARSLGKMLLSFGINVDCAPVADLYFDFADKIIGDRSFGDNVALVSELCRAAIYGFISVGVQPIVKHIPGHGRALCDSHLDLPIVQTTLSELEQTDFAVFKNLSDMPAWAMTAHVIFSEIDDANCITISKPGMEYLRKNLGYGEALIMSDDLSMKALKNSVGQNAVSSLYAGCDIALHCNGKMEEMEEIYEHLANTPKLLATKREHKFSVNTNIPKDFLAQVA